MGTIQLEKMNFYAYHGCYYEEQIVGNDFVVDLTIETDVEKPSTTDNINDALNYLTVYELIKDEMAIKSHLLEHVAKRILDKLYQHFNQIESATIKIRKMNPPLGGQLDNVSVSITR